MTAMKEIRKIIDGHLIIVEYGLRRIGTQAPYFSITAEIYESVHKSRNPVMCGCCHDEVLQAFPDMRDIVSLHLSDIDGVPMHAVENGWYWLSAAKGDNTWEKTGDKDFVQITADYMRISRDDVARLVDTINTEAEFAAWVDTQRPRWKSEANAVIAKYHLE